MKFETKYWICKLKAYFDKGFSLLHYARYIIFAWLIKDFTQGMTWRAFAVAGVWAVVCFWFGYLWFKWKWITAEIEVSNRFNLFVKEMRKKLKK